jgi:hypothetical protein
MRSPISFHRVLRELPEIAIGMLIAIGTGMTLIALFFAVVEIVS